MTDSTYIDTLISAIVERQPYKGLPVHHDAQAGSIFLVLDNDAAGWELYATPDYEGRTNTLPLYGADDDGPCLDRDVPIEWTGDIDTDVALWTAAVSRAASEVEA